MLRDKENTKNDHTDLKQEPNGNSRNVCVYTIITKLKAYWVGLITSWTQSKNLMNYIIQS